jgi:hypothetical protein
VNVHELRDKEISEHLFEQVDPMEGHPNSLFHYQNIFVEGNVNVHLSGYLFDVAAYLVLKLICCFLQVITLHLTPLVKVFNFYLL